MLCRLLCSSEVIVESPVCSVLLLTVPSGFMLFSANQNPVELESLNQALQELLSGVEVGDQSHMLAT
jgi:hypothetical protein